MSPLLALCMAGLAGHAASPDAKTKDIRANAVAATVRIFNPARQTRGSGVIVASEGPFVYVLTASHVVAQAQQVDVQTVAGDQADGSTRTYRGAAVVARIDGVDDLALIRMRTGERVAGQVPVCPRGQMPSDESVSVLVVGWEKGPGPTCYSDRAAKKRVRRLDGTTGVLWQVAAANAAGRSGGPLLDKRGRLIGIASGTNDGKGYFCHIEAIHSFLRQNGYTFLYEEVKN